MKIVTYSLSVSGPPAQTEYHDQLLYSVKSLRLFNQSVSIHAFLYGEHLPAFTQELEAQAVDVHPMGSYAEAIRRIHPRALRTLSTYPVLHKWLNFGELERLNPSQILQADCDTFFFGDVDALFTRYSDRHFYAREEPASKASHYGYDPTYLDENVLAAIARNEGAAWVNPYNIGVCVLNQGIWSEIAKREAQWLSYVFRFAKGMAFNSQAKNSLWPEFSEAVTRDLLETPDVSPLPFPSGNPWILDQMALWLTLGQIPGLTHGFLAREHVAQGGEGGDGQIVHHYFATDKVAYLSEISKLMGLS
jgi:hypothetical protein